MEFWKTWLKTQWENKKFRVYAAFMSVLCLVLCLEFIWFRYTFLKGIRYLVLFLGLVWIAWIDLQEQVILNSILLGMLLIRTILLILELVLHMEYGLTILISFFAGALTGGGIFLLCYFITRGGIGAGDVKLFAVIGYYLGGSAIFTGIFLTVVFAAVYSIVCLLRKKITVKQEIPFAPFILAGITAVMALGV